MTKTLSVLGCVTFIVQGLAVRAEPVPSGSPIEMVVQVYNDAGVEQGTLLRGQREAERIFQKAGIAVRWIACPVLDPAKGGDQVCNEAADPLLFSVWIVRHGMTGVGSDLALGFALPFSGRANHATVVYSKVAELQKQNAELLDSSDLLAHVIAHELAHLLFRSSQHSSGIMQAGWRWSDIRRMGQKQLSFDGQQVRMLHDGLKSRLNATGDGLLASTKR
jgi:hypothetical protein